MARHVFYEWVLARVVPAREIGRPALDAAAHFVLPAWCCGCEARLPWQPSPLALCARCRARLPPPPPAHLCRFCGGTVASGPGAWLCSSCSRRSFAFDDLIAAWSYRPPIDEVIRRLKYRRLPFLAEDLAAGMVQAALDGMGHHDLVAAVPLHWRRRLARGYDQAALIAVAVARRAGLPYRAVLSRSRFTPPQVARSAAARRTNVAAAIRVRRGVADAVQGATVLLVDDVATTGATLDAASRALRAAGVARITALVAALTPPR